MPRERVPKPRLRKGGKTYEVREVIAGKVRTRTLETRDHKEAVRRFPGVYAAMLAEFETPAVIDGGVSHATLTIAEACRIRREELLSGEETYRQERGRGDQGHNPTQLADEYRARLDRWLKGAQARWTTRNFDYQADYLHRLKMSGQGEVDDYTGALRALAQGEIRTIKDIIAADDESGVPVVHRDAGDKRVPRLSEYLETYITRQGKALTETRALDLRAAVRDLIDSTEDKPVDSYTKEDGRVFREVLFSLPPNYTKLKPTLAMSAPEAAQYARENGLKPMAAATIREKRGHLSRVFKHAAEDYDDTFNPFEAGSAWVVKTKKSAANQKEAFTADELKTLFDSDMPEYLLWLSRLALFTGARPNELLQLSDKHVHLQSVAHIYISPELNLKTEESAVRSIPLHPRLIELGFLDYVEAMKPGKLFPGIAPRALTGRLSDKPGKAFARHLAKIGIRREGLSLYSLRHTWKAEWDRRNGQHVEARERLMGHVVDGVAGRYGNGYVGEAADIVLLKARAKLVDVLRFDL